MSLDWNWGVHFKVWPGYILQHNWFTFQNSRVPNNPWLKTAFEPSSGRSQSQEDDLRRNYPRSNPLPVLYTLELMIFCGEVNDSTPGFGVQNCHLRHLVYAGDAKKWFRHWVYCWVHECQQWKDYLPKIRELVIRVVMGIGPLLSISENVNDDDLNIVNVSCPSVLFSVLNVC